MTKKSLDSLLDFEQPTRYIVKTRMIHQFLQLVNHSSLVILMKQKASIMHRKKIL